MKKRTAKKWARGVADAVTLDYALSHARPSFFALSAGEARHVLRNVLRDRRVNKETGNHLGVGLRARAANRIARSYKRMLTDGPDA